MLRRRMTELKKNISPIFTGIKHIFPVKIDLDFAFTFLMEKLKDFRCL